MSEIKFNEYLTLDKMAIFDRKTSKIETQLAADIKKNLKLRKL